jgi:hypothetical protein
VQEGPEVLGDRDRDVHVLAPLVQRGVELRGGAVGERSPRRAQLVGEVQQPLRGGRGPARLGRDPQQRQLAEQVLVVLEGAFPDAERHTQEAHRYRAGSLVRHRSMVARGRGTGRALSGQERVK